MTAPLHVAAFDIGTATFINNFEDYIAAQLAQLVKSGTFSGTTDAAGRLTIIHNLGIVPVGAFVSSTVDSGSITWPIGGVTTLTATTMLARFGSAPGTAYTVATAVTCRYSVFGQ